MSETVIKVENITKFYQLGLINHGTLAKDLQAWWAKLRGKEDPNSRISMVSKKSSTSDTDFIYALKDVSFDVQQGEVLGIIGANGAGKSTLLKILSRVTSPTSGCIKIKGRIGSLLEVGTGFHPELTGRENIYLNGAILGMRRHEIDRKLDEIIDFSGVEKFIDTPVKRYSSGMYVKLAFSVAAHLDAEIMIMDEVLAVGDINFQQKCLQKMNDVSKTDSRTILYVSHNMSTIRKLCDRCIVLDFGKLIFNGNVDRAIDIYMGNNKNSDYPTEYSFKNTFRFFPHLGKDILIEKFKFLECNQAKFSTNSSIKILVTLSSIVSKNGIRIIFRIKDNANINKIAAGLSEEIDIEKNQSKDVTCLLNLNGIVPGKYILSLEVIQLNTFRIYHAYDNPSAEIPIMIGDSENNNWSTQFWGNVRLQTKNISEN